MTRTLRQRGLAELVARFEQNSPVSDTPTALVLDVRDGRWDLYGERQGDGREKIDYEGEILELTWLETTYPPYKGIPEEVFQRALYETGDFRRAG